MASTSSFIIIAVLLVAMLIIPMISNKKRNQEYQNMLDNINVGDIVETSSGIIGKIVKFNDKGEIVTMILETGSKTEKCYLEIDKLTIYKKLKSSKVETSLSGQEKDSESLPQAEENAEEQNLKTEETETKPAQEQKKTKKPRTSTSKSKK